MLELFLLLAVCFTPTTSIHCEEDIDLDDVQQYSLNIFEAGNIEYWRTSQNNFQTYGKFVGNPKKSIVKAGYYTEDDQLIYGLAIDCAKGKFHVQVTDDENKEADVVKNVYSGDLAGDIQCVDGAEFDIWLKVHQPFMMSWIYNGQALQEGTRMTPFRHGTAIIERERPMKVTTKYGSNKAKSFKISSTGAAKFTRVTWGQCVSWPVSMREDCQGSRKWVQARSKMAQAVGGLGKFGSDMTVFAPTCFLGSRYYDWLQESVHPDRLSQGTSYCCCVDMVTGQTIDNDDEEQCSMSMDGGAGGCGKSCMMYAISSIIEKVTEEQDEMDDRLRL